MLLFFTLRWITYWYVFFFSTSLIAAPRCFHAIESNFFNKHIVMEALNIFTLEGVYQSQYALIYIDLMREERHVPTLVKERARRMKPNPLSHPFQPDKAKDLLLNTLYEVFAKVIRKHAAVHEDTIRGMFQFIVEKQTNQLDACFGKKIKSPVM